MSWLFFGLVGLIVLQRGLELVINRRNLSALMEAGARLVEEDGYRFLVPVHAAWFLAMVTEFSSASWSGSWAGTVPFLVVAGFAEGLRAWAIITLGRRWTTRVVVIPGETLVESGPYRWMRHPNYLAVALLLATVPLAFGLWATAIIVTIANAVALRYRVRVEEQALHGNAHRDAVNQVGA